MLLSCDGIRPTVTIWEKQRDQKALGQYVDQGRHAGMRRGSPVIS